MKWNQYSEYIRRMEIKSTKLTSILIFKRRQWYFLSCYLFLINKPQNWLQNEVRKQISNKSQSIIQETKKWRRLSKATSISFNFNHTKAVKEIQKLIILLSKLIKYGRARKRTRTIGNIEASDDKAFSRRALPELEDGAASAIHSVEASPVRSVAPWEGIQSLLRLYPIPGYESAKFELVTVVDILFLFYKN